MRVWVVILLLLSAAWPAHARSAAGNLPVTLYNRDGNGNLIIPFDVAGNRLDADPDAFFQANGLFWLIGPSQNCGYRYQVSSPFCGVNVYSSPDDMHWTFVGQAFDKNSGSWQSQCNGSSALGGCYQTRVIFNAANNNYVMWFNTGIAPQQESVLIAAAPQGPYVLQTAPTHLQINNPGDIAGFVDTNATGYVIYETLGAGQLYVQQLNATYTDGVAGSFVAPAGFAGDSPYLLGPVSGVYHMLWSAACTNCGGAAVHHATASSPLGTWTQLADIVSDGCGGQFNGADPVSYGGTAFNVYHSVPLGPTNTVASDAFGGDGLYRQQLSFTGSTLNPLVCGNAGTLPIPASPPPPLLPAADQSDESYLPGFSLACDITSSKYYFQQFVPTKTTLSAVALPIAQSTAACAGGCTGANGNLVIKITTIDGSGNPLTVLQTVTVPSAGMTWSPSRQIVTLSPTLTTTPGTTYGIELTGTNTLGCFFTATSAKSPYTAGATKISTNGGTSWSTAAFSLKFATIP
jgi:hypothetical protein